MFQRKVSLPITLDGFDKLVEKVVKKYKLPDPNHAAAIISVAIRHLPNDVSHTTLSYLGNSVLKNLANYVANHKSQNLQHDAQILHLTNLLASDPNNQQAIDELQKAANEGSVKAKDAIDKFYLNIKGAEEPATAG